MERRKDTNIQRDTAEGNRNEHLEQEHKTIDQYVKNSWKKEKNRLESKAREVEEAARSNDSKTLYIYIRN